MEINENSLDSLCASLAYAMGIKAPECAADACEELCKYADSAFGGERADRIFMYNPDAIAEWLYEKYPHLLSEAKNRSDIEIPFCTVMPSVTPVCFATMYTGAQPSVHGICRYEKPVISIESIFDSLISAGKKPAIVAESGSSLSKIYLGKNMDYFIFDTIEEVNAKAAELIIEDKYDFIAVYNGNYDTKMHKFGPESIEALSEMRANSEAFGIFSALIENNWKDHNTLVGFSMDHGCHEIDGDAGSHGLDMPEDLNIVHLYKAYPKSK